MKKIFVIGIILLFIWIAITPAINANDDVISSKTFSIPKKEDTVSVTVLEYKPDGTIERVIIRMSCEQAENFQDEMTNVKDLNIRLSIYKKYNLIPQNVTADTLWAGMQEKAQRIGLTQEKLESVAKKNQIFLHKHLFVNVFCSVYGHWSDIWTLIPGYILIPLGTSLFTLFINGYNPKLISFDILDYIVGNLYFGSSGMLGYIEDHFQGLIKMIGFVGFVYQYLYHTHDLRFYQGIDGFAAYVRATGTFQ